MTPKVLVIMITHNSSEYLGDCLSSLTNSTYPKDALAILVIDNSSTDSTVEILERDWAEITLIKNKKNLGFAAANNIGLEYALQHQFDYVYLLNHDTVVEPQFLGEAVAVARTDRKIAAVQSKLLLYHNQGKINSIGNEIHYLGFAFAGGYQQPDRELAVRDITYPSGAACLISVAALRDIGLFNSEFFMYHEDTDLGWRLWLAGYRVVLAPQSVVYHKYEFSRSIKKFYYMERNRKLVLLQNYRLATLLLILPAEILMDLAMLLYSFIAGWWREYLKVGFYFLNPVHWIQIIRARRQVQKKRRQSDRAVIQRFVGKIEFQDIANPLLTYVANPIFNLYWQLIRRLIVW